MATNWQATLLESFRRSVRLDDAKRIARFYEVFPRLVDEFDRIYEEEINLFGDSVIAGRLARLGW